MSATSSSEFLVSAFGPDSELRTIRSELSALRRECEILRSRVNLAVNGDIEVPKSKGGWAFAFGIATTIAISLAAVLVANAVTDGDPFAAFSSASTRATIGTPPPTAETTTAAISGRNETEEASTPEPPPPPVSSAQLAVLDGTPSAPEAIEAVEEPTPNEEASAAREASANDETPAAEAPSETAPRAAPPAVAEPQSVRRRSRRARRSRRGRNASMRRARRNARSSMRSRRGRRGMRARGMAAGIGDDPLAGLEGL